MVLSRNEIKERALKLSNYWTYETKERAEKDSFWIDFFNLFIAFKTLHKGIIHHLFIIATLNPIYQALRQKEARRKISKKFWM